MGRGYSLSKKWKGRKRKGESSPSQVSLKTKTLKRKVRGKPERRTDESFRRIKLKSNS